MDNSSGFVDARSREITRGRERPPKVTKGHKRESYLSQAKAKAQWDWRDGSEEIPISLDQKHGNLIVMLGLIYT